MYNNHCHRVTTQLQLINIIKEYCNRLSGRCRHSNQHVCILDRDVSVATAIRHTAEQLKNEDPITSVALLVGTSSKLFQSVQWL